MLAFLGGLHFWWPKFTGRMYPEAWGRVSALLHVHRLQRHVFPAIPARLPRHAAALPRLSAEFQLLNILSSAGATILAVGLHLPHGLPRSGRCGSAARRRTTRGTPRAWNGRPRRRRPAQFRAPAVGRLRALRLSQPDQRRAERSRWLRLASAGVGVAAARAVRGASASSATAATCSACGRWLLTELLLFAGLFLVARGAAGAVHPAAVREAARLASQVLDRRRPTRRC